MCLGILGTPAHLLSISLWAKLQSSKPVFVFNHQLVKRALAAISGSSLATRPPLDPSGWHVRLLGVWDGCRGNLGHVLSPKYRHLPQQPCAGYPPPPEPLCSHGVRHLLRFQVHFIHASFLGGRLARDMPEGTCCSTFFHITPPTTTLRPVWA